MRKSQIRSFHSVAVDEITQGEEQKGTGFDSGLSHSLIEGNRDRVDQGMMIDSSTSQGLFAFNADMLFEQLVHDFNTAEKIYGETFLRLVSGEAVSNLKKNLKFPEFQRLLQKKLQQQLEKLQEENLVDEQGVYTEKGLELSAVVAYMQELDDLRAKGLGVKKSKRIQIYGEKENVRNFKRHDRFQDIAVRHSVKTAVRRGHARLAQEDLRVYERDSKGKIFIIYALDASGSMKGQKIALCKRAGIALAYKAIEEQEKVGLLVFGSAVEDIVYPTTDFAQFIRALAKVRAKKQTDIAGTIRKAMEMFPAENVTKHLVLLTDAVPTIGQDPKQNTLMLVEQAAALGITISVIGVGIDEEGIALAKQIVEIGNGRLYVVRNLENLDRIVLEDYYAL